MDKSNVTIENGKVLPLEYNITNFGESAYVIADKISDLGAKLCDVNIITEGCDECFFHEDIGHFIGNEKFINFGLIKDDNFLEEKDYESDDIEREEILRIAYKNSKGILDKKLQEFMLEHIQWLDDYSIYMVIKDKIGMDCLADWTVYKTMNKKSIASLRSDFEDEINYNIFIQYEFHKQWRNLKNYFSGLGIKAKRVYKNIDL